MESKIIETAKAVFIEHGYAETSMSEIANRVGINRPTLHYYFRTKDRLYQAIIGSIVSNYFPKVFGTLTDVDRPIGERIGDIIDTYLNILFNIPDLPMFFLKELNRDPKTLIDTVKQLNLTDNLQAACQSLQSEMEQGKLRAVPLQYVFYTFYGLLIFPFLTRELGKEIFGQDFTEFREKMGDWKLNIVSQMENLLL